MGNFSRDTFKLTNVMHQLITGETVTDPRHYVGVRLQQGVPLVDADWNELEDIRRHELELIIRDAIGDGVPGQGDGFTIGPVEEDNDFAIQAGMLVLGGWQVINLSIISYSQLPRFYNEDGTFIGVDLETPSSGRTDMVYLDVWEEEVGAGAGGDSRLVNDRIGIETATRVARVWTVRVAEDENDFDSIVLNEPGHKYYPLAKLYRDNSPLIEGYMIEDLRRRGLNLADSIKAVMYLARGEEKVDPPRFSEMLIGLRESLMIWQQNSLFPIQIGAPQAFFSFQNALNHIYYLTTAAEVNSDTANLNNTDGLTIIAKLADAQDNLLRVIRLYRTGVLEAMSVIDLYQAYIDGDEDQGIAGIRPALEQNNLLGAVKGQEEINTFLGLGTGELPQGSVSANLDSVEPATLLEVGRTLEITYNVKSDLLSPDTPEVFDLEAVVSDVRWARSLNRSQITLGPGETVPVIMTVTPVANSNIGVGDFTDINLIARAHRRPDISSVQPVQRFTIGELPPGETFFFYSGGVHLVNGVLNIPRDDIETETLQILFTLVNTTSGDQAHVFKIDYELVWPDPLPAGVVPANWIPSEPVTIPEEEVAGTDKTIFISLRGPLLNNINTNISFTLQITAQLIRVGGMNITNGKTNTIDLPIVVIML